MLKSEYMGLTGWWEQGVQYTPLKMAYDRIWISTYTLAVYPPMSPWVYALTFLRSTSQGVEARQAFLRGHCPNVYNFSRPIRASIVKEHPVDNEEIT